MSLGERPTPTPGPGEVLVRIHASSLNYRDLATVLDPVSRGLPYPRIPNSDGAGEVVEIGAGVSGFGVGDRVAGTFFQDWPDGAINQSAMNSALGGALDGVLAEHVVLVAGGLVQLPPHLDFAEAATLPCAALTAWHAVVEFGQVKAGQTVLLLGTGGVSIFALQFAVLHGARTILTSKSDDKRAAAEKLGAGQTINYVATPDWERAVLEMTGGVGADLVVEVGGAGTLEKSATAVKIGGKIGLIGVLTGGTINPTAIMRKSIRLQGIYVGSRRMFEDMNRAIAADRLHPVIDRQFAFEDARAAFHHMQSAGHFGKIVVAL